MKLAVVGSINMDMTVTAERDSAKRGDTSWRQPSLYSGRERCESGGCYGKARSKSGDVRMCWR